jgi:hypothetical protein
MIKGLKLKKYLCNDEDYMPEDDLITVIINAS